MREEAADALLLLRERPSLPGHDLPPHDAQHHLHVLHRPVAERVVQCVALPRAIRCIGCAVAPKQRGARARDVSEELEPLVATRECLALEDATHPVELAFRRHVAEQRARSTRQRDLTAEDRPRQEVGERARVRIARLAVHCARPLRRPEGDGARVVDLLELQPRKRLEQGEVRAVGGE